MIPIFTIGNNILIISKLIIFFFFLGREGNVLTKTVNNNRLRAMPDIKFDYQNTK